MSIPAIADVWRDYAIPGVPASGAHQPVKAEIRASLADMDSRISSAVASTSLIYGTRAALFANLIPSTGSRAEVRGDSTAAYNGVYSKSGPTGTGTWVRIADLPDNVVRLYVTGGTANAIVAAPSPQLPVAKGNKLYLLRPTATNTDAVTIDDGGGAVPIKTVFGNELSANALLVNTENVLVWTLDHYQLLIAASVDASSILADAQAAASTATAAAASVDLPPVTANTMLVDNAAGSAREAKTFAEVRALLNAGLNEVANRAALKALDTSHQTSCYLTESGREGLFVFRTGDYSAKVTLDTQEGVYIAADDTVSSSGVWVRQGDWAAAGVLVTWFGVVFDGTTDNTTTLQAALDFAHSTVKRARFSYGICNCASTIDLNDTTGLILEGASGGPTGGAAPGTVWRFTNIGDGITCASSAGLNIRDMLIQNTNASWTGKLINARPSTMDTSFLTIERCTLSSVATSSGMFLEISKNINVHVMNCNFSGAQYQIHGGFSGEYCNVVKIRDCQFVNYGTNAINANAGEEWSICGCTFENGTAGHASGVVATNLFGLTVSGCYFGDASTAGYWIDLATTAGFICTGCMFTGYSAAAATRGISLAATSLSFVIEANRFYTCNAGIYIESGSNYGVVKANYFSGCATKISGSMANGEIAANY